MKHVVQVGAVLLAVMIAAYPQEALAPVDSLPLKEVEAQDVSEFIGNTNTIKECESGVAGALFECPSEIGGRITPHLGLVSVQPTSFSVGDELRYEVFIYNSCDMPLAVPWNAEPVDVADPQSARPIIFKVSLSIADVDTKEDTYLFGDLNQPSTVRILNKGEGVRVKTRTKTVPANSKRNDQPASREVGVSAAVYYAFQHVGSEGSYSIGWFPGWNLQSRPLRATVVSKERTK